MHRIPQLLRAAFLPAAFSLFAGVLAFAAAPARADLPLTVLHTFHGDIASNVVDGADPDFNVTQAPDGTLYGTTPDGGAAGFGCVYKIATDGTFTVLYSFKDDSDTGGLNPNSNVVLDKDGNLYFTTTGGGDGEESQYEEYGLGTVEKLTPAGVATTLYSFQGEADGGYPGAGLVMGSDGLLYGTTQGTGDGGSATYGTVYRISTGGSDYSVQFRFSSSNSATYGGTPDTTLVQSPSGGAFYGATQNFGAGKGGTVFAFTPGSSAGTVKVLHSFGDGSVVSDGSGTATGTLALDSSGNLYGETSVGGTDKDGVVYKVNDSTGATTILHQFTGGDDGANPFCAMLVGSDGNLYGTASSGGANNGGTLFRMTPSGGSFTVLYTCGTTGSTPECAPFEDANGDLIGTFESYGDYEGNTADGIVYKFADAVPTASNLKVSKLSLSPASVFGGSANSTATVTLTAAAPTGGIAVSLASSKTSAASVPSSVMVAAGTTQATFTVTSHAVMSSTTATITATYHSASQTASLTVTPPGIKSVTLSPASTDGGTSTTGNRVYWTSDAPANETVTLTSSNTAVATVPSTVTIDSGSSSHPFTITTKAVTSTQTVTITAKNGSVTQTATLTVTPVPATGLKSVTLSPTSTPGGTTTTANRVYWNGDAPTNETVTLTSSNTSVATVPSSVTISENASSHTFSITAKTVTSTQTVTITATSGGVKQTATLTVTAPAVVPTSITCSPSPSYSSGSGTVTVKLSGPAPSGGLSISLSDNGSTFYTDTVPSGQSSYQDSFVWPAVTSASTQTLGATANNVTVTTNVTLEPTSVTLKSFSFSPSSVKGGDNATGTVTLSADAPTGGAEVEIDEEGTELGILSIPAGKSSASFTLTTSAVTSTTKYTFTASYNNASKTAALTETP